MPVSKDVQRVRDYESTLLRLYQVRASAAHGTECCAPMPRVAVVCVKQQAGTHGSNKRETPVSARSLRAMLPVSTVQLMLIVSRNVWQPVMASNECASVCAGVREADPGRRQLWRRRQRQPCGVGACRRALRLRPAHRSAPVQPRLGPAAGRCDRHGQQVTPPVQQGQKEAMLRSARMLCLTCTSASAACLFAGCPCN